MSNKKIDYTTLSDDEIAKLIDGDISLDQLKDLSEKIGINADTQDTIDEVVKNLYKIAIKAVKGIG